MKDKYINKVRSGFYSSLFLEDHYNGIVYSHINKGFERGVSFAYNEMTLEKRLGELFGKEFFPTSERPTRCMQMFLEAKIKDTLLFGECYVETKLRRKTKVKTKKYKIRIPKEISTPLKHKITLCRLSKLKSDLPSFIAPRGLEKSMTKGFDISKFDRDKKKAVMLVSAKWGGIPRVDTMNATTSYHYVVNCLWASYVELIIAEHLVKEINTILAKNSFRNRIRIDVNHSPDEMIEAIEKLYSGKVNMDHALDFR